VSPYTKTAGNIDADIMVMLQDWSSDQDLRKGYMEERATLGYNQNAPTNPNLHLLLEDVFGVTRRDIYATNLFPFVKLGAKSSSIPMRDLIRAADEFALPQIRIVDPRLVICLGVKTFDALRQACGKPPADRLDLGIASPFGLGETRVWCQAHTSRWTGGKDCVFQNWQRMKRDYGTP
jgi:restriction system protein